MATIGKQVKENALAIIGLIVALIALGHSTWRTETTETNRNTRWACFEVLKALGELQVVVNSTHYSDDKMNINPMVGWGYVALVGDLSHLLPSPIPENSEELVHAWSANWKNLRESDEAADKITDKIDADRMAVLDVLKNLR